MSCLHSLCFLPFHSIHFHLPTSPDSCVYIFQVPGNPLILSLNHQPSQWSPRFSVTLHPAHGHGTAMAPTWGHPARDLFWADFRSSHNLTLSNSREVWGISKYNHYCFSQSEWFSNPWFHRWLLLFLYLLDMSQEYCKIGTLLYFYFHKSLFT